VRLQYVWDSVSPCGRCHRQNDNIAAEVEMNDVVAAPDDFRALIKRYARGIAIGPVGAESNYLKYAHQLSATIAGGGRTSELGGTSLLTSDVAATVEFVPMVTPRRTELRAQIHAPSSKTMGPLSNSNVADLRSWLPAHTYARCEMHTSFRITMPSML
jgi:hypothetical protein